MRRRIKEIKRKVKSDLCVDKLKPRGTNNKGYKILAEYITGKRSIDKRVRKQLYEYRVFLAILDLWADQEEVDDTIFFSPCTGSGSQLETAPSIFVEPALPVYEEDKFWRRNRSDYFCLRNPDNDGPDRHVKPDMLLTQSGVSRLPWTARTTAPIVNERRLMQWCGRGEFARVKSELGINQTISTAQECYSVVQSTDKREDPSHLYKKWEEFQPNARYIVESKHSSLTEEDYSQILWYGIVYQTPIIIITQQPVSNWEFLRDIENLPIPVHLIEHFDTYISVQQAREKLSILEK